MHTSIPLSITRQHLSSRIGFPPRNTSIAFSPYSTLMTKGRPRWKRESGIISTSPLVKKKSFPFSFSLSFAACFVLFLLHMATPSPLSELSPSPPQLFRNLHTDAMAFLFGAAFCLFVSVLLLLHLVFVHSSDVWRAWVGEEWDGRAVR